MDSVESAQKIKIIKDWLGSGSINVFGRPFAGKDTQCQKLAKLLDAPLIGGGDITRSAGSAELKQQVEAGFLAPTVEFLELVLPYLNRPVFAGQPLILNSVGRWRGEELSILEAAAKSGHQIKAVVYIKVSEALVRERWQAAQLRGDRGKRRDDDLEKLDVRLTEFETKTLPVVEFYKSRGLLIEFDGAHSPATVTQQILEKLSRQAMAS